MIRTHILLLVALSLAGSLLAQQPEATDMAQIKGKLNANCKTRPAKENEVTNAQIESSSSSAEVKAFSDQLNELLAECKAGGSPGEYLENLRLGAYAVTASTVLNPGLSMILEQTLQSQINQSAFNDVVTKIDQVRPDKQLGSQANASGSTSLVSKEFGTSLLGLAVDSGALTQSVSGTTDTISGNLEAIAAFLRGQSSVTVSQTRGSKLSEFASNVNLSGTFTLSQPSTESTSATQPANNTSPAAGTTVSVPSSVGRFTGASAKFAVRNPFNPHSAALLARWDDDVKNKLQPSSNDMLQGTYPLVRALDCAACQTAWTEFAGNVANDGATLDAGKLTSAFETYAKKTIQAARQADTNFDAEVIAAAKSVTKYQTAMKDAVDNAKGTLFTVEYDYAKPTSQPQTHTAKLVLGDAQTADSRITTILGAGKDAKSLFTANLGVTFYGGSIPASSKYGRLYNGQAAAEADFPMAFISASKPSVFSLAGYWQYQPNPSVLNITAGNTAPGTTIDASSQVLLGTAGSLFVTQAKISIGSGSKSGVTIPIGVKWSNKPNLLTGTRVGGQIGISYDLQTLRGLF